MTVLSDIKILIEGSQLGLRDDKTVNENFNCCDVSCDRCPFRSNSLFCQVCADPDVYNRIIHRTGLTFNDITSSKIQELKLVYPEAFL